MGWTFGQKNIDKLKNKKNLLTHKIYGTIYQPYYNLELPMSNKEYCTYNKDGKKMRTFFFRDIHIPNRSDIGSDTRSKYFIFDRYNFGLDVHFYSHKSMLETMGNPLYKYGIFFEPESITPDDYKIFDKYKGINKDFDLIFTHNYKLLNKYSNCKYFPFFSKPWYGDDIHGGKLLAENYKNKTKDISMLSSDKLYCELHKLRMELAYKCKNIKNVDTYGTFDGGPLVKNSVTLEKYRYSIILENEISPYFFTQKLTSCFASQTIPIYLGDPNIGERFNLDGIIIINKKDLDNIEKVLIECSEDNYNARIPAIIDNYERVKNYNRNIFDYMAETYLHHLIEV